MSGVWFWVGVAAAVVVWGGFVVAVVRGDWWMPRDVRDKYRREGRPW